MKIAIEIDIVEAKKFVVNLNLYLYPCFLFLNFKPIDIVFLRLDLKYHNNSSTILGQFSEAGITNIYWAKAAHYLKRSATPPKRSTT